MAGERSDGERGTGERPGERLFGAIEAGGTKTIAGLIGVAGDGARRILARERIATTSPGLTIAACIAALGAAAGRHGAPAAIGIASFGPLHAGRGDARWGHIAATPKPGWSDAAFAQPLADAFAVPVGFDTDVNGAALAEARWGAGVGADSIVYVTVGTGIGGGAVVDGRALHGLGHPEMGHARVPRHPDDAGFAGVCPFHGDCLEGLASGPAVAARWGAPLSALPADHPGHAVIAWYLAQMVTMLRAVLAPQRIIMGGGVMQAPGLVARIIAAADDDAAGYFRGRACDIVTAPALGEDAGLYGGLALAMDALEGEPR